MPDPILLTPGPLTTAKATKEAMLRDFGSRDGEFIELNAIIRREVLKIAGAGDDFIMVPLQGSGTFAVEAMLSTLTVGKDRILLLVNGAYGERMAEILRRLGRDFLTYKTEEDVPPNVGEIDALLEENPSITHIAMIHCETTAGILNPVEEIARLARKHNKKLLLDSMSAFGALPLNVRELALTAFASSANKCLEGVPGMAFVVVRKDEIEKAKGNALSLSLDLYDQWQGFEKNGQWRFTPPTHVIAAFAKALEIYNQEGGQIGRFRRYRENTRVLRMGMEQMGFTPLLPENLQAPIISTFLRPDWLNFAHFYNFCRAQGFAIYPGKLTRKDTFRIGSIGAISKKEITNFLSLVNKYIGENKCAP